MNDPWMEHLEKHHLLELHKKAQQVQYRVRVANGYIFDLEYEGGLDRLYQPGFALKRFEDTEQGRKAARVFLSNVKISIDEEIREEPKC